MFVSFLTKKSEWISVNADKMLFFCKGKNGGCSLVLDDGTVVDCLNGYEALQAAFLKEKDLLLLPESDNV